MNKISNSIKETYDIAKDIAKTLKGGEIILLNGDLGAGKTTFTKGLAKELGIKEEIVSPTFIMMREYEGRIKLYHFDLYRVSNEEELEELGLKEYLYDNGICVIEWNKFSSFSDSKVININIKWLGDNKRSFEIK